MKTILYITMLVVLIATRADGEYSAECLELEYDEVNNEWR